MKTILWFILLLSVVITTPSVAQKGKIDGSLNEFLNSEFMIRFRDIRIEAEGTARSFKAQAMQYPAEDVRKVQIGYDQTASRFNQVLTNIKMDFLNPKKIKYISEFPDDYLRSLTLELNQLSDFYAQNFLQPVADAKGQQVDGAILLIVAELVGLSKGLFDYFDQIKRERRQYNEAYLQQNLVNAFRFKYWHELGDGAMMPDMNYQQGQDMMQQPNPNMNQLPPLQLPALEQAIENKMNNNPYNQAGTYDEWLLQQQQQQQNQYPTTNPYEQTMPVENPVPTPPTDSIPGQLSKPVEKPSKKTVKKKE